jgi:hypothetical protein
MPNPLASQVHVNAALTMISVAFLQDNANYIADKIFPPVPVEHQSDVYYTYTLGDFFRDEATLRADGTESAGGGFNLTTSAYFANVVAFHKDVGEQMRANADPAIDPEVDATKFVMQRMLIKKDRDFVSNYLANGVWGTDVTGTAGGTPGSSTPAYWNDDANGDPFTDIATGQTTILENTGFEPNVLLLSWPVYQALRKHPLVIDRIKYTTRADASKITPELLAGAFDVEKVVVSKAVYNSAAEGLTASMGFIANKDALLAYRAPAPGLMQPSAGYIFPWRGFTGLNSTGVRIKSYPIRSKAVDRVEGEMSYAMNVVATPLAYHFSGIVQ